MKEEGLLSEWGHQSKVDWQEQQLQLFINMEQTEDENYFMDPYDNYSSKTIATVAYILGLPCCFVVAVFIWFEASGRAGPYRTCINQLVSRIYFLVIHSIVTL